jgi:hypothetical protein
MPASKYKEEYCDMLIKHCQQGLSFGSFCGVIRVSRECAYQWTERHKEFGEAKDIADSLALLFYEKLLSAKASGRNIEGFDHKKSDIAAILFPLKTRFWRLYGERPELNQSINITISKDESNL